MSRKWFIADPHFGHKNIIRPDYCDRPYASTHEMNKDMTRLWNSRVAPEDTVYNLGDTSFRPNRHVHHLNGRIILVRGNHDHRKFDYLYAEVHDWISIKVGKWKCILTHIPVGVGNPRQYKGLDLDNEFKKHDFVLCGHVHEKWLTNGKNLNVGVDQWGFAPVSENRIVSALDEFHEKGSVTFGERPEELARHLLEILDACECDPKKHKAWRFAVGMAAGTLVPVIGEMRSLMNRQWMADALVREKIKIGKRLENGKRKVRQETEQAQEQGGKEEEKESERHPL